MDVGEETANFKWLLYLGLIFLVITAFAFNEIRYMIWGVNVDAKVTRIEERTKRVKYRDVPYLRLTLEYKDKAGQTAQANDTVDINSQVDRGDVVPIQYIPGSDSFRLQSNNKKWALWLFFIALTAFLGYFAKLFVDGSKTSSRSSTRRMVGRRG